MHVFLDRDNVLSDISSRDAIPLYAGRADKSPVRELILNGHDFQPRWQRVRRPSDPRSSYGVHRTPALPRVWGPSNELSILRSAYTVRTRVSERNRRLSLPPLGEVGPSSEPFLVPSLPFHLGPFWLIVSEPVLAHWREGSCYEISMSDRVKVAKVIASRAPRERLDMPVRTARFAQCRRS